MAEFAAVVGIGQTKYQTIHKDFSIAGLLRDAAQKALIDAECTWNDIDAVIIGKAPDMFEGVVMPESYLTDALTRVKHLGKARQDVVVVTCKATRHFRAIQGGIDAHEGPRPRTSSSTTPPMRATTYRRSSSIPRASRRGAPTH